MRILLLSLGSWAVVALAGCSGSEFSAAHGAITSGGTGNDTGGTSSSGSTTGNGGTAGSGGKGVGGSGAGGSAGGAAGRTGTGGGGRGGTGTGGSTAGTGGTAAGGTIGSGGVGTGGSGGSRTNAGDCRLDHNDCGTNSRCVEVIAGGYRVCTVSYPPVTSCSGAPQQQCCSSADCQNGAVCYAGPLAPNCGGIVNINSNVCSSDICTSDTACGSGSICVPAGTMDRKVRMCVPAGCHRDTDCTKVAGGICAPVATGCCNGITGLYCVYPGGCRSNKDCPSGNCEVDPTGAAACASGPAVCPL